MSNPSEDLAILREESDVSLQKALEVQRRLEPVEVTDDSRQIIVKVSPRGVVESVRIGITWDRVLSPSQLSSSIFETISAAQLRRLEQYGSVSREVDEEPSPRARPSTSPDLYGLVEAIEHKLSNSDASASLAQDIIVGILDDTLDGITEANELLSEHTSRTFSGFSANRKVQSTFSSSGQLVALDIDQGWLGTSHPANLGREITQAILDGSRKVEIEGISAALSATKLARAALAASDPESLID